MARLCASASSSFSVGGSVYGPSAKRPVPVLTQSRSPGVILLQEGLEVGTAASPGGTLFSASDLPCSCWSLLRLPTRPSETGAPQPSH
ncbi:hypothetical protein GQ53DRAFT_16006 [Thozetella sp. PMI_491]|nr:hypothetical protein GQ53DRAFT_16006 [Thozetella sp. PMI_491]